jgi:DnaJ-class molecular chaperone
MFHNLSAHHPHANIRIFTHSPMNSFNGSGNIDIEQLFSALHGNMATNIQKPLPIIHNLSITLEQVLTGANIPIQIEKWVLEHGNKIYEFETINVEIPKGVNDNEVILLREKGNVINSHNIGDIKIIISIQNNTTFKRCGLDLIYHHTITLKEALCGFKFELTYLNGKTYNINNTSGKVIVPGHVTNIPSLGLTRNDMTGSLQIHFTIDFPMSLTDIQISQLTNIL